MNARRLMEAPPQAWRPHVTTPLHPNAAVHHSKNCALNVADGSRPTVRGMSSASPLYLNEPTSIAATFAAGQCRKRLNAPQHTAIVFDHLVGTQIGNSMPRASATSAYQCKSNCAAFQARQARSL